MGLIKSLLIYAFIFGPLGLFAAAFLIMAKMGETIRPTSCGQGRHRCIEPSWTRSASLCRSDEPGTRSTAQSPNRSASMTQPMPNRGFDRELVLALIAVVAVGAASILGQLATYPNLVPWYANLEKPWFTPPSWVFGPVWTALYALMGFALWRVLRAPGRLQGRRIAVVLFGLQLFLNAAWSWMFFGANSPLLGMINIVPQLLIILATIAAFARVDKTAAWCLVPLGGWIAYATVLNVTIWQLNG